MQATTRHLRFVIIGAGMAGPEIREYFEGVADRYDLNKQIVFNAEIASCRFVDGRWRITTPDRREDVAPSMAALEDYELMGRFAAHLSLQEQ